MGMLVESTPMGNDTRRDLARARSVEVMNVLREIIAKDERINLTNAAEEAGVAPSTFYRWLKTPPKKIDVVQVAALADYLHTNYGHQDFAALWRDVSDRIK